MKTVRLRKVTCPECQSWKSRAWKSDLETLYSLRCPPAVSDTWGFPVRRAPLWGDKQPVVTEEKPAPCPDQHPREWAGVSEASWAPAPAPGPCTRQPGSQASVAPLLPAPLGIGNRKKQTGPATQQLRQGGQLPSSPRAFPICFPEAEEVGRQGPAHG